MSDWTELMGSDIRIRRLEEGKGSSANIDTVAYFDMKTYYLGSDGEPVLVEEEFSLAAKIGESDFLPGVELGLRYSKVGEHFSIRCHQKFGYGSSGRRSINGCPIIPPDVEMQYEVRIAEHKDYTEFTLADKVALRKRVGNYYFGRLDFDKAARCYSSGVKLTEHHFNSRLDGLAPDTPVEQLLASQEASQSVEYTEDEKVLMLLYIDTLNNLAATFLSLQENMKAREACVRILELNPGNKKCLLRAAKASRLLHEYDEASLCLSRLLDIDPDNEQAKKEKVILDQAIREYRKKDKEMAKKISKSLFKDSKISKVDPVDEKTNAHIHDINENKPKVDNPSKIGLESAKSKYFLLLYTPLAFLLMIGICYYLYSNSSVTSLNV